jgi:pantetheine-phosphate adenylyltransferase
MKREYRIACLGGTFDIPIHKGHEALLRKAFEAADFCCIGLSGDEYAWRKGKRGVRSFEERKGNLVKFLGSIGIGKKRYEITMLDNFFSPEVIDPKRGIEAIIVSKETLPGARGINLLREDRGMRPLEIVEIPMVLAKDKLPISSTRIRVGEITPEGKIKSPKDL